MLQILRIGDVRPTGERARKLLYGLVTMAILEDLIVFQLASALRDEVLALVAEPAAAKEFKLANQLKDAAGSIAANVAEGYGRQRHADFARFLEIANGSTRETEARIREGLARRIWPDSRVATALNLCKRESVALNRLRAYLKSTRTP